VSDDPIERLRSTMITNAVPFPMVHDTGSKVGISYWVDAVPSFFVVDRAGNVAYAREGWDGSAGGAIEQEVLRLLGQSSP
jgi:hypothetical protein